MKTLILSIPVDYGLEIAERIMGKVYNNTDEVVLEFGDIETDDIGVEMYGLEGLLRSLNDEAYPTERYMTYVLLHESQITP